MDFIVKNMDFSVNNIFTLEIVLHFVYNEHRGEKIWKITV